MYTGAMAVGLSRMYHSKHWGSDVVLGAAIGTFSGRKVVQYVHGHPGNVIDRVMLRDRKSTRLNSSHLGISYAVFCLKKKKTTKQRRMRAKRHNTDGQ